MNITDTIFCIYLYTGPWQVMLKQADGSYACVAESTARFTLGEVSALVFDFISPWCSEKRNDL